MFRDHFWLVGDRPGQAWSSAAARYVPATDGSAEAAPIERLTRIASERELDLVLRAHGLGSPLVTAADVRAEASRRMQALVGARDAEHLGIIISNGVREQGRLQAIRTGIPGVASGRDWSAEEAGRAAALWSFDKAMEAIRAASNAMESSPPGDFRDDTRWPGRPS